LSFVLDTSIALAWCFKDEQTPAVMAVLDRLVETSAMAPLLWPLEAMNGLFAAERRRRIGGAERVSLGSFLRDLPVKLDMDTAERVWDATAAIAARFGLTIYDATYLELSLRRRLPLATLDRALQSAAKAMKVELLGG